MGKEEIEVSAPAAREAFPAWSSRRPQERSLILNRVADVLEQSLEELAQAESKDQGKTLTLARTMDIPRSVLNFRFFASSIQHHVSD
ncbi:5-carboxymethyl-2-hydroxymuconate semialdehyde dehydrogenase, partial [Pasteurella multocida]